MLFTAGIMLTLCLLSLQNALGLVKSQNKQHHVSLVVALGLFLFAIAAVMVMTKSQDGKKKVS